MIVPQAPHARLLHDCVNSMPLSNISRLRPDIRYLEVDGAVDASICAPSFRYCRRADSSADAMMLWLNSES